MLHIGVTVHLIISSFSHLHLLCNTIHTVARGRDRLCFSLTLYPLSLESSGFLLLNLPFTLLSCLCLCSSFYHIPPHQLSLPNPTSIHPTHYYWNDLSKLNMIKTLPCTPYLSGKFKLLTLTYKPHWPYPPSSSLSTPLTLHDPPAILNYVQF